MDARKHIKGLLVGAALAVVAFIYLTHPGRALAAGEEGSRTWESGPVLDQEDHPYCVGYAYQALLESEPFSYQGLRHPSAMQIYVGSQYYDEYDDGVFYEGTSLEGGARWLETAGFLSGSDWTTDTWRVRDYILTEGPVVVGSEVTRGFRSPLAGFVNVYPGDGNLGLHAFECYGYDGAQLAFLCQNSWGVDWGAGGRFKLKLASFMELVSRPSRWAIVGLPHKDVWTWESLLGLGW